VRELRTAIRSSRRTKVIRTDLQTVVLGRNHLPIPDGSGAEVFKGERGNGLGPPRQRGHGPARDQGKGSWFPGVLIHDTINKVTKVLPLAMGQFLLLTGGFGQSGGCLKADVWSDLTSSIRGHSERWSASR
jgi:hypothetical protein